MRVLISAVGYALASLALGPVNSGIVLAHVPDLDLVIPRIFSGPRRRSYAGGSGFPAPTVDRSAVFLAAADAKRARKAARRLELAA